MQVPSKAGGAAEVELALATDHLVGHWKIHEDVAPAALAAVMRTRATPCARLSYATTSNPRWPKRSMTPDAPAYRTTLLAFSPPKLRRIPSSSRLTHCSAIFSFWNRNIAMASHVTGLPFTS
jgi:hypothetical protein